MGGGALRIATVAMNAYREAVRGRVLHGLLGLALATAVYSLLVATLSLHQETRVIADLGAASISLYAVLVAIVLGATSLHREIELKTVFPILTRPLRRHEYVLGKYLGTLATLLVFVALDGAAVMALLAAEAGQKPVLVVGALVILFAILAAMLVRARYTRVFVIVPWALAAFGSMALLAAPAGDELRLLLASTALTMCESMIVAAVATLFAAFSSPFLTAVFTLGVFVVGRSAETLGNLPARLFGGGLRTAAAFLSHVFPNLHVYVPPRPLLLGHVAEAPVWRFVGAAALHAVAYAAVMMGLSMLVFRKRDFT